MKRSDQGNETYPYTHPHQYKWDPPWTGYPSFLGTLACPQHQLLLQILILIKFKYLFPRLTGKSSGCCIQYGYSSAFLFLTCTPSLLWGGKHQVSSVRVGDNSDVTPLFYRPVPFWGHRPLCNIQCQVSNLRDNLSTLFLDRDSKQCISKHRPMVTHEGCEYILCNLMQHTPHELCMQLCLWLGAHVCLETVRHYICNLPTLSGYFVSAWPAWHLLSFMNIFIWSLFSTVWNRSCNPSAGINC